MTPEGFEAGVIKLEEKRIPFKIPSIAKGTLFPSHMLFKEVYKQSLIIPYLNGIYLPILNPYCFINITSW